MENAENVVETPPEQPPRSAGRTILRNTLYGMGSQFALRGLGFLFSILVVRRLGDASFGQYSVVLAWAALFSFLGDLGIAQYMTREIARKKDRVNDLFWDVAVLRLILAIVASIITIGGAILKPYDDAIIIGVTLYTVTYFLQAFYAPLMGLIAGHERMDVTAVFSVISQILFIVFGAVFLFVTKDFVWLILASIVSLPIQIVLSVRVIRRYKMAIPRFRIQPSQWGLLMWSGLPFAFIQVALTTAYQFDRLILENSFPPEVVGWYSAAYNLARTFLILTSAFSASLVVTLAGEFQRDPKSIAPWYGRSVKMVLFVGLPLAIGGTLLANQLIPLIYGEEYSPGIIAFAILIWDTPLLMFTSIAGNLTASIRKERTSAAIYFSEAIINVGLNLLLIPRYGIVGAAVTTVATELVGVILFTRLFRREFGFWGIQGKYLVRLVVSAGVMAGVVLVLRLMNVNILLEVVVGGAAYLGTVFLTKALTPNERELVMRVFRRVTRPILALAGRNP